MVAKLTDRWMVTDREGRPKEMGEWGVSFEKGVILNDHIIRQFEHCPTFGQRFVKHGETSIAIFLVKPVKCWLMH
jgi:hypothetical protein